MAPRMAFGVHPPETMKHFPPISENSLDCQETFASDTFPCDFPKKYVFSSAKISDDPFLVIDSKFLNLTI